MITYTKIEKYNNKDTIFKEDSGGDWMYVIIKGKVEISKIVDGKKVIIDQLKEGDIFGEMAFFSDHSRSASAVAKVDTQAVASESVEVGVVDIETFQRFLSQTPSEVRKVIKTLVSRLRITTNRLTKALVDIYSLQQILKNKKE